MAIATAVLYLIALALPIWLVVEEIAHHQRRAESVTKRATNHMEGPEMAPHTPRRSERPGEAVALLVSRR